MMRLSEAIRLGSMLGPQAFGHWIQVEHDLPVPGDVLSLRHVARASCALQAALDAIGIQGPVRARSLRAAFPEAASMFAQCPACPQDLLWSAEFDAITLVMHLNDGHEWLRERIADWVESREREQDAAAGGPATALTGAVRG